MRRLTSSVLQFLGISIAVMMAASALGVALTTSASVPAAVGKSHPGRVVVIGPHGVHASHSDALANRGFYIRSKGSVVTAGR